MLTNPEHMQLVKVNANKTLPEVSGTTISDKSVPVTDVQMLLPVSLPVSESANRFDFTSVDLEAVESDLWGFKEDLATFQMELEEQKNMELLDEQIAELQREFEITPIIENTLHSAFLSRLDSEDLSFFYSFEEYWSFISVAKQPVNVALQTYVNLAMRSEPILYSIIAVGGIYLELRKTKSDFSKPWSYMQKAAKLMCNLIGVTWQHWATKEKALTTWINLSSREARLLLKKSLVASRGI